jgi:hypothetical protein
MAFPSGSLFQLAIGATMTIAGRRHPRCQFALVASAHPFGSSFIRMHDLPVRARNSRWQHGAPSPTFVSWLERSRIGHLEEKGQKLWDLQVRY